MFANAATTPPNAQCGLIDHLLHLASDTYRAGLRHEAEMIVAMIYSVLDGTAGHAELTQEHEALAASSPH